MEKILIGLHEFNGPYNALAALSTAPGLIAVLSEDNGELELMDIEEAADIQEFWNQAAGRYLLQKFDGAIRIAVCEMPHLSRAERQRALSEINDEFGLLAAA